MIQETSITNNLSTRPSLHTLRTPPFDTLRTPLGVWFLILCCLVGYGLRFGFLILGADRYDTHLGDQHRYKREAENLLHMGTFAIEPNLGPTAFDGPIYACSLVPFLALFGEQPTLPVAVVQSVISLLTAWMIARITWWLTGRAWAARIALLWWCVYPFAIFYTAYLLTETLYGAGIVASVLCAYLLVRDLRVRYAVILGLVLGLTSLTRPTVNICVPFLFLGILVARWDQRGQALKGLVVSGITLLLVLSPWIVRNYSVFGRILPGSSQTGRMLYLANNPDNYTGGVVIDRDARPPDREPHENELEWNERLGHLAKQFIRENPGRFLHLCGMRLYNFWRVTPMFEGFSSPLLVAVCLGSFVPLFGAALCGFILLKERLRLFLPLLAVILSTYALHVVFGVSLRYRFPIEPLLIPAAAYSLSFVFQPRMRQQRAGIPSLTNGSSQTHTNSGSESPMTLNTTKTTKKST